MVLIDLRMLGVGGTAATAALGARAPAARVLVLTTYAARARLVAAVTGLH